jgi:hypothetical protein
MSCGVTLHLHPGKVKRGERRLVAATQAREGRVIPRNYEEMQRQDEEPVILSACL